MSPSPLALEPSSGRRPAALATPRTCPMVVVTDVDGTLRDPLTQSLAPADLALSISGTLLRSLATFRWLADRGDDMVILIGP